MFRRLYLGGNSQSSIAGPFDFPYIHRDKRKIIENESKSCEQYYCDDIVWP